MEDNEDGWCKVITGDQEERVDGGEVGRFRPVIGVCMELISFSIAILLQSNKLDCHKLFSSISIGDEFCHLRFVLDERDQMDGLLPPQEFVHLDLKGPPGSCSWAGLEKLAEVYNIRRPLVCVVHLPEELKDML